jgi:phosphoglycolate phosphatase-like HAD superfamily hydrolase
MSFLDKKYLVFDFDGTIDQLIIDWSNSRKEMMMVLKDIVGDQSLGDFGNSYDFQIEMIKEFGDEVSDRLIELSKNYERENYSSHRPNINAVNFIKDNQDKYKFFLWTSNHIETIAPVLKELGLNQSFQTIVSRDSVKLPKPDADGFSQIFIPGTNKDDYLMIGDTTNDSFAAENSGIDYLDIDDFEKEITK